MNTGYILGISRGHNSSVCLLKDGEIVFSIEEERLSRHKYDGGPYAAMIKVLEYTDKIDYLVVAHTQSLSETAGIVDFTGDNVYTGLARKLGLIDRQQDIYNHPQVIDLSHEHHKLHAACAFYRSGFDSATAVIVDGAGTFIPLQIGPEKTIGWETESIFACEYPFKFTTKYKHIGVRGPSSNVIIETNEDDEDYEVIIAERAGITKIYEAVTEYCGWSSIEAGKTMGLFPYGKSNNNIPPLFDYSGKYPLSNRNIVIPTYPNGAQISAPFFAELDNDDSDDLTLLQNRRDLAYSVQTETQKEVADLIRRAVKITGNNNVVLSGGYGLNCVANYYYLNELKDEGISLYVEPISNDAGTAIGAALMMYKQLHPESTVFDGTNNLYLGPGYSLTEKEIADIATAYEGTVSDCKNQSVVGLLTDKNIVAVFQGRSENGPRALGNRSLLFDPRFEDGKDYVNQIKNREYFRPFAGSILEEDVHEWFDLRGMASSPSMMYAVNCQPGVEGKIPSIIHVDGTCRIQTVNEKQNQNYYDLIKAFKEETGIPIVFNTSFNLGGEPLVETIDDAVRTLANSDIEYLYLPEYNKLITIKNNSR